MVKEGEGRVKEVWAKNMDIKEKNNSLSLPSLLHPYPLSILFFPLFLCVCARGGEGREVSSRRSHGTVAVGTSGTAMPLAARSNAPSTTDLTRLTEPNEPGPKRPGASAAEFCQFCQRRRSCQLCQGPSAWRFCRLCQKRLPQRLQRGEHIRRRRPPRWRRQYRGFRQFCRFCQRCILRPRGGCVSSVGFVIDVMCAGTGFCQFCQTNQWFPPETRGR